MAQLCVEYLPPASLVPYARNPRTHSRKQIRQIAESIRQFGWTNPILIDRDGGVVAGHGRLEAAKLIGLSEVPTICLDQMSDAARRAYVIADNKLALNAGWDEDLLRLELQGLIDLDFDVTITGFEMAEIDIVLQGNVTTTDPQDDVPDLDPGLVVVRPGDLFRLGEHRLLCGDARDETAYATLLGGEQAQMVFIDPPYNVPIDGHVCGLGSVKHAEFAMASGEMSRAEFTGFLSGIFKRLASHSRDGSIHFVCMDWRHLGETLAAGREAYGELKNLCAWVKDNGGMGSLYRSQHELVLVFKNGSAPHINNIDLGKHGRYRTNVWSYPGVNTMRQGRLEELAMHPTVKPVALVADAILDCSRRKGLVLDVIAGSGTTILAAERTGRQARCLEIDPRYVEVALRRFETATGKATIHEATGLGLEALRAEREAETAHE